MPEIRIGRDGRAIRPPREDCAQCGAALAGLPGRRRTRFCSRACSREHLYASRRRPPEEHRTCPTRPNGRRCEICGGPLLGRQRLACGDRACKRALRNRGERQRLEDPRYRRKWNAVRNRWHRADYARGGRLKQYQQERRAASAASAGRTDQDRANRLRIARESARRRRRRAKELAAGVPAWAVSEPLLDSHGRPIRDWYPRPEDEPDPGRRAMAQGEALADAAGFGPDGRKLRKERELPGVPGVPASRPDRTSRLPRQANA